MNNTAKLFKKEWTLLIKPSIFIFVYPLLAFTLLSPDYPYFLAFWYCLLGIPVLFSYFKGNKDLEFTSMLPIKRADIVKSKFLTILFIEMLQIIVAIPFAIISALIVNPEGNLVGLDANFTLFATQLIGFGIFNIIFAPFFFKTGYKVALPTTFAYIGYFVFSVVIELVIGLIPAMYNIFDGYGNLGAQIGLLAFGIVFFVVTFWLSYKLSVKNFEKVNL